MKQKSANGLYLLFWCALFFLLVFLFNRWDSSQRASVVAASSTALKNELVLKSGKDNHYRFTAKVNGIDIPFLVDTGASKVAIPEHLAKKAGLIKRYQVTIKTANGLAKGYLTRIKTLHLGPIQLHNISAIIISEPSNYGLLGMSALGKLEFRHQGRQMILTQTLKQK